MIPPTLYQAVNGNKYRHIWAVGDLHGCHRLLMNRLDEVGFKPSCDLLISVGDLIDRGPDNAECLELLQMPWFRAVRGNHEQMAIDGLGAGDVANWMANGGDWYFRQDLDKEILTRALMELVKHLPHVIELQTRDRRVVIAHADYPAAHYAFGQQLSNHQVIWNRDRISDALDGKSTSITGADLFVFGHSPVNRPARFSNQLYIDTGAVFCGNLTLIQLQGSNDENCISAPLRR
ncbi:metallophosphoesterase [Pantoea septica]|uniref:metallophosphoesterase n=1 Tax=Pantoea septica TaxID=472695 RepID=UPI0023F6D41B|nr:metallophosphoesterase [Pantoea septica]